jgi:hypothetical protein
VSAVPLTLLADRYKLTNGANPGAELPKEKAFTVLTFFPALSRVQTRAAASFALTSLRLL